jgi:hypothetical protein
MRDARCCVCVCLCVSLFVSVCALGRKRALPENEQTEEANQKKAARSGEEVSTDH